MTAALAAAAIASLLALKLAPAPWVWVCVAWAVALFVSAVKARVTPLKAGLVAVGCVAVVLAAAELVAGRLAAREPVIRIDPDPMYRPDSVLGWRLFPGVTHAVEHVSGRVVYDVRYTVDSLGHRATPAGRGGSGEPCVLFLADSYTFGLGLPDEQTLPWLVGAGLSGRMRAVNLGTPAYGAEHVLARLERGDLADVTCHPVHVIYQALPHHVLRAAGRTSFSRRGPRYALGAGGRPVYQGTATPQPQRTQSRLARVASEQLDKSSLYAMLVTNHQGAAHDEDYALYLAIVARMRALFAARYPDADFSILLWLHPRYASGGALLRDSLRAMMPHVYVVDSILPGYPANPARYELHPADRHPNAAADSALAAFVIDSIVRPDAPRGKVTP